MGGGLNDDHMTGEPGPESALYTAVVLPCHVLTQGPVSIEDARGGGRGRPVGLGTIYSLKQEAGSRPQLLVFSVLPQVGVSEAGLQHEILRRARDLADAARVQPGADSRLFPGLLRPRCMWTVAGLGAAGSRAAL